MATVAVVLKVIKALFERYSEKGIMTVDHLYSFLVEILKQDKVTMEEAKATVDHYQGHRQGLSLDGFFQYLFGDDNPPLDPKLGVHHDMIAPLSHYFIFTGHNSYLTGNQLSSDCSDVPIIHALQKGVRVIELDIWPNSTLDDVDVLHGSADCGIPGNLCLRMSKMVSALSSKSSLFSKLTAEPHVDFPSF